ncbi:hypothetical protein [Helicobacter sp. T3_23-1056]
MELPSLVRILKLFYALFKKKPKIIFLTGETGVGKDTVKEILQNADFIEKHIATPKVDKGKKDIWCGYYVQIQNTGGADMQSSHNNDARRELRELKKLGSEIYYVYVFDANQYFSVSKETIHRGLQTAKKFATSEGFELRIIGTHRDKAQKYESKMNDLSNELRGKYGKCEIYDLTQAKMQGKQMQQKLSNFIIKE